MRCFGKFYGMQVSMTQQSGDFLKQQQLLITRGELLLYEMPNIMRFVCSYRGHTAGEMHCMIIQHA